MNNVMNDIWKESLCLPAIIFFERSQLSEVTLTKTLFYGAPRSQNMCYEKPFSHVSPVFLLRSGWFSHQLKSSLLPSFHVLPSSRGWHIHSCIFISVQVASLFGPNGETDTVWLAQRQILAFSVWRKADYRKQASVIQDSNYCFLNMIGRNTV